MNLRFTIGVLCVLGLAPISAPALDLTPRRGQRVGNEGGPTPVVQFMDGDKVVDFQPPHGWEQSGGGNAVSFFDPKDTRTWMKLMVIGKQKPQAPGGAAESPEDLQKWVEQFIPAGASKHEFVKAVPSPFSLGKHSSTEFIFNIASYGWQNSISISVVDLSETERLLLVVSADAKDFDHTRQQAIASMFSWSEVEHERAGEAK